MKKSHAWVRFLTGAAGVCFALLLLSCVSLGTPSLPKPHSASDTLLVVPLGRAADSDTGSFGSLRLTFATLLPAASGSAEDTFFDTGPEVRSAALDATYPTFGTVRYLRPGNYAIDAVQFVSEAHRHRGKRHNLKNIEFTVQSGTITVLPYRFLVYYTRPILKYATEEYRVYIVEADVEDIEKMSEQELERLRTELSGYNNAELWKKR